MKDIELSPCPFCGSAPRYLEHKAGFYSERVICDSCGFYLPPERWRLRAAVEADRAQSVPDGKVLVDRGAINMVINALRRDAEQGRSVRGEMADALLASTPAQPAPQPVERKPMVDPCPGCTKGHVCRTPKCGRLALQVDHPLRCPTPGIRE